MSEIAATPVAATTFARLVWPSATSRAGGTARAACLAIAGACLLTIAAKVQVPGPVPMTLQTLAVLALGASLGLRLGVAAVGLYLLQGAMGFPVFANTPPLPSGIAYLSGPTGGFLLGFAAAAAIVGAAADGGLLRRPVAFGAALAAGTVAMLGLGWLWLAAFASVAPGMAGVGAARAFAIGVQPFLAGELIKLGIACLAFPLLYDVVARVFARRP